MEKLNIDEESKNHLVDASQLDIRRIITMLEYLSKNNDEIRIETTLKILENYDKKNMELNLYEITEKMLNKYHSIDETYQYFNLDKTNWWDYICMKISRILLLKIEKKIH